MAADRKKEILDAAVQCFGRHGYEKTTVDDIGALVGINKASLYYHFKNKETIFAEALFRESEIFGAKLRKKVESVPGCVPKVLALIREGLRRNQEAALINLISLEALKGMSPMLAALRDKALSAGADYLASILRAGQETGEILPCDAQAAARSIQNVVYALNDSSYLRSKSGRPGDKEASKNADEILAAVALMLDGLAARRKGDRP